ncbi:VOC family protein [Nocardioides nematodiphilus]|uniref:VOC family protein n=1 Tax=Nocardioides nematodiphilus TaxID=2849669 RepID=UPI001CD936D5|nr:VOC family protein [Nocardioides nematodiphilus]MCA1983718.1 VOC family protein [Nocardioides nematodiphilus]
MNEHITSTSTGLGTCLWFDGTALPAAELYAALIPNSRITHVSHWSPGMNAGVAGEVMTVLFELDGRPYRALNGGPGITPSEAYSFDLTVETQEEIDRYVAALTADGGEVGPCGWLKDRFGYSWQVVPTVMAELAADSDPTVAAAVINAMLGMRKLDIAALQAAADAARQEGAAR